MARDSLKNKKILVTYGPTWMAIDDMRIISNRSSGQMGKLIIEDLIKTGAKVTALEGPINEPLRSKNVRVKKFTFFDEFKKLFKSEIQRKYDIIIHAAAVSDFKVKNKNAAKISSNKAIALKLIPAEKLIQQVKRLAPKTCLVGFKLESAISQSQLKKAALNSIAKNKCDLVIANSLKNGYTGFIFDKNGSLVAKGKTRATVSKQLITYLNHCGE